MAISVSVALTTFNSARFIEEQVRSILEQDVLPDEIVVADDGSTDDSLDRIRSVVEHGNTGITLTVLPRSARLGVTANFERAVAACTGDVIALSDHDDRWHRNRLSSVLPRLLAEPKLMLMHSDARLVDASGSDLHRSLFSSLGARRRELEAVNHGRAFNVYLRRNLVTGAATVFRRSLLAAALPFPGEWVHDEWLGIMAAATGDVHALRQELIDYRQHGQNQIGVSERTVQYRAGRMLARRGERYTTLAARAHILRDRLDAIGAPPQYRSLAARKAQFEDRRAEYPAGRIRRIGPIWREYRGGAYSLLSSQGDLDIVRDLLQPA